MDREIILKEGSVKLRVKAQGMLQLHTFKIEKEETPYGVISFLVSEYEIPEMELLRIAKETNLPVKCKRVKFYPPGKLPQDFAGLI
ncbi:MAG: hypothetical protein WC309_04545 [Candidatus Paceibacterota bacterium]|jgi:hypothetical protein